MNYNEVYVKLYPICDCGYIFKEGIKVLQKDLEYEVNPSCCLKCCKKILGVIPSHNEGNGIIRY